MQDNHENTGLSDILAAFERNSSGNADSDSPEHKMTSQEAAAKVEEMFAQAREQSKTKKKKRSSSSAEDATAPIELPESIAAQETENKAAGSFTGIKEKKPTQKEKEQRLSADVAMLSSQLTDGELSAEEAEKKITEMLSVASSHNQGKAQKSRYSAKTMEVIVVSAVAILLFFVTMDSGLPGAFSPGAILLPAMFGIGYRYFKQHLPIKKAVSESKPHIFISTAFLIIVILAFI